MATVTGTKRHIGITSDTYDSNGDVVVGGNLTINGTTTTLDTANLLVEDKNIIIGNVSIPSDTTANGGGITLKGASDYTINWASANNRWEFNQGIHSTGEVEGTHLHAETYRSARTDGDVYIQAVTASDFVSIGTQVANNLMRIQGDGNVGIGTTSPGAKLHVNGDLIVGGDSTDAILRFFETTNGWTIRHVAVGNRLAMSNVLGGTDHFNITEGGNVGIGTTSPSAKLQVNGNIRATGTTSTTGQIDASPDFGAFRFYNGSIFRGGLGMGQWASVGNSTDIVQYLNNVNYYISNSTTALVKVEAGGNVGIGTTSPTHKLEVGLTSSVALASQPAIPLMISNDGNSVDGRVLLQVKHDTINTAAAIGAGYKMTAAAVTSGTASYYDSLIFLKSAGAQSETVHSAPKNIKFYTNNSAGAAGSGTSYQDLGNLAFDLQADGDAIFYENVGIGTTSPVTKLHLYDNTATVGLSIQADNASSSDINLGDEDDINIGRIKYDHSDDSMQIQVNNSEKMRITSAGGVSFGSTGTAYGTSGQVLTSNGNTSPTWEDAAAGGVETISVTGTGSNRVTTIAEGLKLTGVEDLGFPSQGGYTMMGISNGSNSIPAGTVVSFHDSDTTENDDSFALDLRSNGDYFWNMHGVLTIEETNQNRGGDLVVENSIGFNELAGANATGNMLLGMSNGDLINGGSVFIGGEGKVHLHGNSATDNLEIHQTGAADIEINASSGEVQLDGNSIAASTGGTERMRITSAGGVSFGASGTAYGTSGQVLTSAGNGSPTWEDAAGESFTPLAVTKNGSNQFPIVFANAANFSLSCSGVWTITATIASGDIGKTGTIIITNTAATTPGSLPSTFKTPNGDSVVFETDNGDVSILSYLVVSTSIVLVNYVGNFS